MARKNTGSSSTGKYGKNKFQFVNLAFDDPERERIIHWCEERKTAVLDIIVTLADASFKVTFGYNSWTEQYTAAITDKDVNRPTYNQCLTYEHTEIERLAQVMLYVYTEFIGAGREFTTQGRETQDW